VNFQDAAFETSFGLLKQIPAGERPEIVFSGRSNVGKSSLINKLLNRKAIARVSSMPGKTVTINFYRVDTIRFVDLPGYGYAKVAKGEKRRWTELIEGYFAMDRDIALVVQLIDVRHPPTADDRQMIEFLVANEFPFLIALTKADKLGKTALAKRLEELRDEIPYGSQVCMVATSAEKGDGMEELRGLIEEALEE
jgi:GTP-binding protein